MLGQRCVTADRVARERDASGLRHVVQDDVGPLRVADGSGDVGQGDQVVELLAKHRVPRVDRVVDGGEVRAPDVGRGLHGDGEVGVVPPVAGVVVGEDLERFGVRLGQVARLRGQRPRENDGSKCRDGGSDRNWSASSHGDTPS